MTFLNAHLSFTVCLCPAPACVYIRSNINTSLVLNKMCLLQCVENCQVPKDGLKDGSYCPQPRNSLAHNSPQNDNKQQQTNVFMFQFFVQIIR